MRGHGRLTTRLLDAEHRVNNPDACQVAVAQRRAEAPRNRRLQPCLRPKAGNGRGGHVAAGEPMTDGASVPGLVEVLGYGTLEPYLGIENVGDYRRFWSLMQIVHDSSHSVKEMNARLEDLAEEYHLTPRTVENWKDALPPAPEMTE